MPCKGDELCCDESSGHTDFDSPQKSTTNDDHEYSNTNVSTTNHSSVTFDQPNQQPSTKPLTNGSSSSHEGPRQIFVSQKIILNIIIFDSD